MDSRETIKSLRAGFVGLFLVVTVFFATFFRESFLKKFNLQKKENLKEIASDQKDSFSSLAASPSEVFEKIGKKEMMILDVRPRESFLSEHILDSQNIPAENLLGSFPFDNSKKYVLIDEGDNLSTRNLAGEISKKNPSLEISYLSGGFSAWKVENKPTISFGDPLSLADQAKVTYIKSEELKKILDESNPEEFFILDVRKSREFSEGRLKNATNIFLEDLEKERKKIPLGKKIVICDNDGFWAYMAAVRLFDMGIKNSLVLSDGLDVWKEKGFEIIK